MLEVGRPRPRGAMQALQRGRRGVAPGHQVSRVGLFDLLDFRQQSVALSGNVPGRLAIRRTPPRAGLRIFEWVGPMLHAKTVVADNRWVRVGSSNLNSASLMGNWEIDVGVQDRGLAAQLEGLFLADLASSREIVTAPPPRLA